MMSSFNSLCVLTIAALALITCQPTLAYDEYEVDTSSIGRDTQGVVNSGQILELGVPSASGLHIEGENYLQSGQVDKAIVVLQRSLELSPSDVDVRILYGTALEKKLFRQNPADRDPGLFNFVVKQWLFVAKSGEFGDQMMEGYNHLQKLTGTYPKKREKEKKFLERVLIPEDGSVKVTFGKPQAAAGANSTNSKPDSQPVAQRKKKKDEDL